jgi:tetratricopeptide (TPR) repeat protein
MALELGHYTLHGVWGQGGTATVWRAEHRPTGAACALKTVHLDLRRDDLALRQFRREVRAAAALDHANVARIYDQGVVGAESPHPDWIPAGSPYLVFEALPGGDLGAHRGTLPWPRLRDVVRDILAGLAHAHARGVLHRDLKPTNVLFDRPPTEPGARAVLTDFGIARVLQRPTEPDEPEATLTALYLGTPHYSSSEQIVGPTADVGPWSDLYSLGATVWAMVTGQPPFRGTSTAEILHGHVLGDLPDFVPVIEVPLGLEDWLRRCLVRRVSDRYQRASDALTGWTTLDPGSPIPARERPPPDALTRQSSLFGLRDVPLVGRAQEVIALSSALGAVLRDGGVRIVLLRGQAGAGTSRLARHTCEQALESGTADVIGSHPTAPGGAGLRAALARRLRVADLPLSSLRETLPRRLAEAGLEDPGLTAVLLEELHPGALERPPDARARRAALRSLLAAWSRQRPLILWLDDLPWTPEDARLLPKLVLEDANILVIATANADQLRPGSPLENLIGQVLASGPHADITVPPLKNSEAMELVAHMLFAAEPLKAELALRSGGVPLYARQLVAALIDRGALQETHGGLALDPEADVSVPEDLRRVWLDRIDSAVRGEPALALALDAAAALGGRVDLREWAAVCARLDTKTPHFLPGRLAEQGVAVENVYDFRFSHALARDALEDRARAEGRWARVCAACADALREDARPATHARRAAWLLDAGRPAEAFGPSLKAAVRARDGGLQDDAIAWLDIAERCLREDGATQDDPRWIRLGIDRAQRMRAKGDYAEACAVAEEQTRRAMAAGDDALVAESLHLQGVMTRMIGRWGESLVLLREALAVHEGLDEPTEFADALASLGQALRMRPGHDEEAGALFRRSIEALGDRPAPGIRGRLARLQGALALSRGNLDAAQAQLELALSTNQRLGRLHPEARVRHDLGIVFRQRGDFEAAEKNARMMLAIADRIEHGGDASDGWTLLGDVLWGAGRMDEAEEAFVTALKLAKARDSGWWPLAQANLGMFYVDLGRYGEALAQLEPIEPLVQSGRPASHVAFVRCLLLCARIGVGSWTHAEGWLERLESRPETDIVELPRLRDLLLRSSDLAIARGDLRDRIQALVKAFTSA